MTIAETTDKILECQKENRMTTLALLIYLAGNMNARNIGTWRFKCMGIAKLVKCSTNGQIKLMHFVKNHSLEDISLWSANLSPFNFLFIYS